MTLDNCQVFKLNRSDVRRSQTELISTYLHLIYLILYYYDKIQTQKYIRLGLEFNLDYT